VTVVLAGVGAVAVLAPSAGLLLTGGNALPTADEAAQQYAGLDAYNATYTVTFEEPGETRTVRVRNTVSPDSESSGRGRWRHPARPATSASTTAVSPGSTTRPGTP